PTWKILTLTSVPTGRRRAASSSPSSRPAPRPSAMAIKLNHTIVHSKDPRAAAEFFTGVFGLPAPKAFGPFLDVHVGNEVTLAFLSADGMEIQMQHYAFLVSE